MLTLHRSYVFAVGWFAVLALGGCTSAATEEPASGIPTRAVAQPQVVEEEVGPECDQFGDGVEEGEVIDDVGYGNGVEEVDDVGYGDGVGYGGVGYGGVGYGAVGYGRTTYYESQSGSACDAFGCVYW